MTELDLIVDLHCTMQRQGPGSTSDTLRALGFMSEYLPKNLSIADIGCGSGGQTITLARHIDGHITAVDLFPGFLEELESRSTKQGLSEKITTVKASMDSLPFSDASYDLIWSEGAIYNIGFENGIRLWRPFIKDGGYLAVSEITWITNTRPKEIEDFWTGAYSGIDTAANKIIQLERNGFSLAGYFHLSPSSWLKEYYTPLQDALKPFLAKHNFSELATKVAREHNEEIELYRRYQEYYSYGFYVARKSGFVGAVV